MRVSSMRLAAALVFGAGLVPLLSSNASAEETCMLESAKLSDTAVSTFNDQPSNLIARHPSGGPALSSEVRRLAASDVGTAPKLIALAKAAKPEHIVALAIGLAQAAAVCAKTNPKLAETIKTLVAVSGNAALTAAFAAESSLFALAPEGRSLKSCSFAMGEPPDVTASPASDEGETVTLPSNTEEPDTADKLGINEPDFLFPSTFNFGVEPGDTPGNPRKLPQTFGGGGLVATTGNVVSPTR